MANIALLREAREVIAAIPDNVINLDAIQQQKQCGTVCCAAGWLAHDPKFRELGLDLPDTEGGHIGSRLVFNGREMWWERALGRLFSMGDDTAMDLFAPRGGGLLEDEIKIPGTDKELWLERVDQYISKHEGA
jgi:hypothetical protein